VRASRSVDPVEPEVLGLGPTLRLQPIGVVRCGVSASMQHGWGQVVSELHFAARVVPGLQGVEEFSHLAVLFFMHRARFASSDLVRRPRRRPDMPEVGIFAQRASCRPNPIGLTVVRLLGRQGATLRVRGLDAIDGTPILDVKPHFRAFDRPAGIREPPWVSRLMSSYF
jgi:tRNA-Thr(GGU) m(6)t(6)A37 methyltransferase TsaA